MRTITVKKFASFAEADEADRREYREMTAEQRLELVSQLRAMRHGADDATAPRLARVYRITKLQRS